MSKKKILRELIEWRNQQRDFNRFCISGEQGFANGQLITLLNSLIWRIRWGNFDE